MAVTNYLWDQFDNVIVETYATGYANARYTHEPSRYGQLISQERDGTTSTYGFDGVGSTRQLTDESEIVTRDYTWSAYGEEISSTGSKLNPFGFAGKLGYYKEGSASDYLYVRARHFNSQLARWMSTDPLPTAETSPYGYCYQNPVNHFDPSGMITSADMRHIERTLIGQCNSCDTCNFDVTQCDPLDCQTEATDIAQSLYWTWHRNWRIRFAPTIRGYYCYEWAWGFQYAIEAASPSKCFSSEVRSLFGRKKPFQNGFYTHYYVMITSSCNNKFTIYIDNNSPHVYTTPPIPRAAPFGPYGPRPNGLPAIVPAGCSPATPFFGPPPAEEESAADWSPPL